MVRCAAVEMERHIKKRGKRELRHKQSAHLQQVRLFPYRHCVPDVKETDSSHVGVAFVVEEHLKFFEGV